jgi:site-specific recombinase XerD
MIVLEIYPRKEMRDDNTQDRAADLSDETTVSQPDGARPQPPVHVVQPATADQNPAAVYLASLAPGSRPAMRGALKVLAEIATGDPNVEIADFPWVALRFQHTAALRAELAQRYSHSTANKMLSALRGTLKAAWKLGQMPAEAYHKAISIGSVHGESVPAGRAVPSGELRALLMACDQSSLGMRDAAVLSLLYGAGLRRAEVVALDVADYDVTEKVLRVRGKRNKQRLVPVLGGVAEALADWLVRRGRAAGPLFVRIRRGDHLVIPFKRLSTQAVYNLLQRRAKEAGVADLSPHDLRRSFVSDLLDAGADIATVQKLAGHASVNTTARYDRRGERAKQQAAALLHIPYQRRTLPAAAGADEESG